MPDGKPRLFPALIYVVSLGNGTRLDIADLDDIDDETRVAIYTLTRMGTLHTTRTLKED